MSFVEFLDNLSEKSEPVRRRIYVLGIIGAIFLSAGLWILTNKLSEKNFSFGASFRQGLETFRKISGQNLQESKEGMANIFNALRSLTEEGEDGITPKSSPKVFQPRLPLSE